MGISPVLLVLCAIFLFICAFIVPILLYLRQVAMKADITDAIHKVELMNRDYSGILTENATLKQSIADVTGKLQAAEIRAISTEETIRALANKMNSRERVERKRHKEEAEEKEVVEPSLEEMYPQLELPFAGQSQTAQSQPLKRQFGVIK